MKKLLFIASVCCMSCTNDNINECINPEQWGEINACPQHLDYVCGCNDVTYDNECFAKAAGVVRWTNGACN